MLHGEGASVLLNGRSPESASAAAARISPASERIAGFAGDVQDHSFADAFIRAGAERFGGIDILITNAGGPPAGPFENQNDDAWQQAVEVSFLAHVRMIRAARPFLQASAAPAVLTITSFTVKQPLDNLVLSNSVRAATLALTKSLSQELGDTGIRFNSILPGWTRTDRVEELMRGRAESNGTTIEEEIAQVSAGIPLGRMGSPEEFAHAACFLVSPAASYITGVMLQVDGGLIKGLL
jgi:3-oxoacyl-[acyl-carrier protein] reductase